MLQTFKLLLPALIPSWNFFDVIAASPRIEYALQQSPNEAAEGWREFRPRPNRVLIMAMLARLFWNAGWNEALFALSCAERLLDEPNAYGQEEILRRIAADLAPGQATNGDWISFRIILLSGEGEQPFGSFPSSPFRGLSRPSPSHDVKRRSASDGNPAGACLHPAVR